MALIQQTEWHGNPRPRKTYAWSEENAGVITHGVSRVPYAEKDDNPSGATDIAGPAAVVEVSLAGPMPAGTIIQFSFLADVTAGNSGLYNVPIDSSPEEVAADMAAGLGWVGGAANVKADDPRVIQLTPLSSNSTLTVNTWAVT